MTQSTAMPKAKIAKTNSKYEPQGFSLKVKRSSAGLGLFAGEDIPKGKCIIEYVGRVISKEEEMTSRSQYLFEVNKTRLSMVLHAQILLGTSITHTDQIAK